MTKHEDPNDKNSAPTQVTTNRLSDIQMKTNPYEEHFLKEMTRVLQEMEENTESQHHLSSEGIQNHVVEPIRNTQGENESIISDTNMNQNDDSVLFMNKEQINLESEHSQTSNQDINQVKNDINHLLHKLLEKEEKITSLERKNIEIENRKNQTISDLQIELAELKKEMEILKKEKHHDFTTPNPKSTDEKLGKYDDAEEKALTKYLRQGFSRLEKQMNQLNIEFTGKLKFDENKERIIDNLHRELQTYKDDQIKDIVKPFVNDMILTADRTMKLIEKFEQDEKLHPRKLVQVIKDSAQDIEDILFRQGVESFHCEGDMFDAKRQQIVKTIKTGNPAKDKKIAEVVGHGYEWDGKIIRPEKVNIYLYDQLKRHN